MNPVVVYCQGGMKHSGRASDGREVMISTFSDLSGCSDSGQVVHCHLRCIIW